MKRPPPLFFAEKIIMPAQYRLVAKGGFEGFDWNPLVSHNYMVVSCNSWQGTKGRVVLCCARKLKTVAVQCKV